MRSQISSLVALVMLFGAVVQAGAVPILGPVLSNGKQHAYDVITTSSPLTWDFAEMTVPSGPQKKVLGPSRRLLCGSIGRERF